MFDPKFEIFGTVLMKKISGNKVIVIKRSFVYSYSRSASFEQRLCTLLCLGLWPGKSFPVTPLID